MSTNKAMLIILDGWGFGNKTKSDVISTGNTPYWHSLLASRPYSQLGASGEDVGLPDGQMGNSEVGHLNIGAGRVLYQDLVKINKACKEGTLATNPELVKAYTYAKENNKKVHLLGLVSNGGVHSSQEHIYALAEVAKKAGLSKVFVHAFMDGRDTDPKSGKAFLSELVDNLKKSTGAVASVCGRYYAMDRDKRWDRVKLAYDLLTKGVGTPSTDVVAAVQTSYDADITDEFIKPIVAVDANGKAIGNIEAGDVVIFFNYRNDRARELTMVLSQKDMVDEGMKTLPLQFYTMTPYDSSFKNVGILYDKDNVENTIGEVVAKNGIAQLRIAETEKYAHVTFFFSGGRESVYEHEDRVLINSPKVATYDLQPEMSAFEVKDAVVAEIKKQKYGFIALNYANGDMVGHTGIYEAIEKAVTAVDTCLKETVETAIANNYDVIIIADHGNADFAFNEDGSPNTAHSLNPVPFVWVSPSRTGKVVNGILADVAPSILNLMGVEQPKEMTGKSLITLA